LRLLWMFLRAQLQPEVADRGIRRVLARAGGAAHAGFDAVAPGMFGLVKRGVSRVKQFLDVGGSLAGGDAETQADLDALSSDDNAAFGNVAAHSLGEFPGLGQIAARSDDQKFFAPAAAHGIVRANHC